MKKLVIWYWQLVFGATALLTFFMGFALLGGFTQKERLTILWALMISFVSIIVALFIVFSVRPQDKEERHISTVALTTALSVFWACYTMVTEQLFGMIVVAVTIIVILAGLSWITIDSIGLSRKRWLLVPLLIEMLVVGTPIAIIILPCVR